MPTRSTGCFACRKRKIRCDEARPGCQRCVTHGVTCPGYREDRDGGIEWRDQTDVTALRVKGQGKRGRGGKGKVDGRGGKSVEREQMKDVGGSGDQTASFGFDDAWTPFPDSQALVSTSNKSPWSACDDDGSTMWPQSPRSTTTQSIHSIAPAFLPSPSLERASLYQSFIDAYLPRQTLRNVQEGHFHFFQELALRRSTKPALQHGFDALSLVQIGSTYHSPDLLREATKQYAVALRALGCSIAKGDFLHDDEILAAVVVLSQCELYDEIQVHGQGWKNHVAGANQLVAARGPASLNSDLALLLFATMRHGTMINALIERKAPFMARREWRDVAWRVPVKKDQSSLFYEWGIRVPGLLERHDQLDLQSETALEELDAILKESSEIEHELRMWFAGWSVIAELEFGGLWTTKSILEFPTFMGLVGDDAFETGFWFPDFLIGYLLTVYWMTMHFLRESIQSLHKTRHRLQHDWFPDPAQEVHEDELLGYILNLCQSMPFFCEPESSSIGSVGIFLPMRTAAMYFTAHGHWRLLRWIGAVRDNAFVKGVRPPVVNGKAVPVHSPPKSLSSSSSPSG